ncbi:hypothetical protein [Porphyromonas pogonae]|nr:hypothetical protein [Porphyromonas pogonae]
MTKRESRKQRSNWPAMQRSLEKSMLKIHLFVVIIFYEPCQYLVAY